MKCTICSQKVAWGGASISIITTDIATVNLCHDCRLKLFGSEVDRRVRQLVARAGWVQPRLFSK